jgi:hypothetical protein
MIRLFAYVLIIIRDHRQEPPRKMRRSDLKTNAGRDTSALVMARQPHCKALPLPAYRSISFFLR